MAGKSQLGKAHAVLVVEADILDKMNETDGLIAERAYEIYQSRGSDRGAHQDDWFRAEEEVLHPLAIERDVTESAFQLTAQVPGFDAKDLEVALGHRRIVICGIHSDSKSEGRQPSSGHKGYANCRAPL